MALQRAPSGAGWVIPGSAEAAGKRKKCHCRGDPYDDLASTLGSLQQLASEILCYAPSAWR